MTVAGTASRDKKEMIKSIIGKIKYMFYRVRAHLYSLYQMNFNPDWKNPLPPIPCNYCGKTDHRERYCPNAKGLGFLD